jgi:predicted PurR-regulated permease PerM
MNNHIADASRDRLLGRITALLWVVVIALAVTFFYFASSFWITLLLAGFLAILVEPLVALLERLHLPRSASATLVIVFGMVLLSVAIYAFYNQAADFVDTLPQYTSKIRKAVEPAVKRLERMQESAKDLNPAPAPKKVPEVRVSQPPSWPSYLARGVGSVAGATNHSGNPLHKVRYVRNAPEGSAKPRVNVVLPHEDKKHQERYHGGNDNGAGTCC